MAARALVVEDEPQMRRALRVGLTGHGYEVALAATEEEGLDRAATSHPDIVILDLMLPGMSGLDVCRELRGWSKVPIIVLSARDQERDKVEALDLGADDYLTKPFGMDELVARLRAALRRSDSAVAEPVLSSGDLRLDQARRRVTIAGDEVRLTPTEYDLLRYLMANAGKGDHPSRLAPSGLGPWVRGWRADAARVRGAAPAQDRAGPLTTPLSANRVRSWLSVPPGRFLSAITTSLRSAAES